jgi:hypothetical protein
MRDGVIIDDRVREETVCVPVRVHDGAGQRTLEWPLRTLIAWLFVGRQCDEVRALLARGETTRDGTRATWAPVRLSAEELTAIERTFPAADPTRPLDPARARATLMTSHGSAFLAPGDVRVRDAASRATYRWFDYGVWADVWEAASGDGVVRFEMPRPGEIPPWSSPT